ncbi:MAG: hypothetical protein FJX80_05230 [Bacteroidetes bacterium]|nr:hypothetical protein [Bacteroidota bacterium]
MSLFSFNYEQLKDYSLTLRYSSLSKDKIACVWSCETKTESTTIVSIITFDWALINDLARNEIEWVMDEFYINPSGNPDKQTRYTRLKDLAEGNLNTLKAFLTAKRGQLVGKSFGF